MMRVLRHIPAIEGKAEWARRGLGTLLLLLFVGLEVVVWVHTASDHHHNHHLVARSGDEAQLVGEELCVLMEYLSHPVLEWQPELGIVPHKECVTQLSTPIVFVCTQEAVVGPSLRAPPALMV